jgi:hypothetical protein
VSAVAELAPARPSAAAAPRDDAGAARGPLKVLFLAGYSRSGSTLFDRMLGESAACVSTGELAYIWTHGVRDDRLCGCGLAFSRCPFWQRVGELAFGGWDAVDLDHVLALYASVNRHRYLPLMLFPGPAPRYRRRLEEYAAILARLLEAIRVAGGGSVVVDSSIDPCYGVLLRRVPGIDLRVVHFVRDSRGTAHSWTRAVVRHDVVRREQLMPTFPPAATAVRWSIYHVLVGLLVRRGVPSVRVRYEDVVGAPVAQLRAAARLLEEDVGAEAAPQRFRDGRFALGTHHTVAGNRMRLQRGLVAVAVDDEWRTALPRAQRRAVTALSWPLLVLFGYIRPRGRSR